MDKAIFLPVAALVALTFGVALLLLRARFRAAYRRQVTPGDFRYGESERVPLEARLPSRNWSTAGNDDAVLRGVRKYVRDRRGDRLRSRSPGRIRVARVHSLIHLT